MSSSNLYSSGTPRRARDRRPGRRRASTSAVGTGARFRPRSSSEPPLPRPPRVVVARSGRPRRAGPFAAALVPWVPWATSSASSRRPRVRASPRPAAWPSPSPSPSPSLSRSASRPWSSVVVAHPRARARVRTTAEGRIVASRRVTRGCGTAAGRDPRARARVVWA